MMGVGLLRAGLLFASLTCGLSANAFAHSWYPAECCDGRDCMRVDQVEPTLDGGMRLTAGDLQVQVPKGFTQRPSRDNDTHVCVRKNGDGSYVPRCVFVPSGV